MATDDFFRARLETIIDLRHPLAVLAPRLPWAQTEASVAPLLVHRDRPGRHVADADLFGQTIELADAGPSAAGHPRLPFRLMVSLLQAAEGRGLRSASSRFPSNPPLTSILQHPQQQLRHLFRKRHPQVAHTTDV